MSKIIFYVGKKKYDATKFLNDHPGGKQCLIKKNNTDVTIDYNFHSKNGKKKWKEFLIEDNSDNTFIGWIKSIFNKN